MKPTNITDIRRVRLRKQLDEVASRYPHLVDPEGVDPATWEALLEDQEDPLQTPKKRKNKVSVTFRLDHDLTKRLNRYTARMSAREQVPITRTLAVESLFELALDLVDSLDDDHELVALPATVKAVWAMTMDAIEAERAAKTSA